MSDFSPDNFKIILFVVGLFIIYGFVIYLVRGRIVEYFRNQSEEKKVRLFQGLPKLIRLCKLVFWISPFVLVFSLLHLFAGNYDRFIFNIGAWVIANLGFFEVFLFSKMLMSSVGESVAKS